MTVLRMLFEADIKRAGGFFFRKEIRCAVCCSLGKLNIVVAGSG